MFLIQITDRLFKGFLTDAKCFVNLLCRALVMQSDPPSLFTYIVQESGRKVFHLTHSRLLKHQVDLAILTNLLYIGFQRHACMQRLEYLAFIEQSAISVLNDGLKA